MWPFRRKQRNADNDDSACWSVAQGQFEGSALFARIRSDPRPCRPDLAYDHRVGFAVPLLDPDPAGLPQGAEFEALNQIEDFLTSVLEADRRSVHVLSISTRGMREFVFYTSDPEWVRGSLPKLTSHAGKHELQHYIEHDPDWELYRQFASSTPAA